MPTDWKIYRGEGAPDERLRAMLANEDDCPPWRNFAKERYPDDLRKKAIEDSGDVPEERGERGENFVPDQGMIEMVNAALYLRRPLLITGPPGVGKSSLIHSVARELKLGRVLRWPITSRTAVRDGLYQYDAIGRLQAWQLQQMRAKPAVGQVENLSHEFSEEDIGEYLALGPLGAAMLPGAVPRALLIDEIDKGDADLANDLLDVLEEGAFTIPELARLAKREPRVKVPTAYGDDHKAVIVRGRVECLHFPFVVLTSNGERDFPPAFQRRCLHLKVDEPDEKKLWEIVAAHLEVPTDKAQPIIADFVRLRQEGLRTNDQLLQAVFLMTRDHTISESELLEKLLSPLTRG